MTSGLKNEISSYRKANYFPDPQCASVIQVLGYVLYNRHTLKYIPTPGELENTVRPTPQSAFPSRKSDSNILVGCFLAGVKRTRELPWLNLKKKNLAPAE